MRALVLFAVLSVSIQFSISVGIGIGIPTGTVTPSVFLPPAIDLLSLGGSISAFPVTSTATDTQARMFAIAVTFTLGIRSATVIAYSSLHPA